MLKLNVLTLNWLATAKFAKPKIAKPQCVESLHKGIAGIMYLSDFDAQNLELIGWV